MTHPTDLHARLTALEGRVPMATAPALPDDGRRSLGRPAALVLAPLALAVLATTALAGGAAVAGLARGTEGVENPGQPLEGAALECLSPLDAATVLAERGFTNVVWQIESGGTDGKGGSTVQQATAPEHGYVVPGSIVDGALLMVVDQRPGATGSGACPDLPMP